MNAKPFTTPTDIAFASKCLHNWFLECTGDVSRRRPPDAGLRLIMERGIKREEDVIARFDALEKIDWDGKDWNEGMALTEEAMKKGNPWIYQGVLIRENMRGRPDLLKRIEGHSKVGEHSYIPVDIKGHKEVTKKDRFQLNAYADMLHPLLGKRPLVGAILLNTGKLEEVDLTTDESEYRSLRAKMESILRGRIKTEGFKCGECNKCPWIDVCSEDWKAKESVCLLYGVSADMATKFSEAGFPSWRKIADARPKELAKKLKKPAPRARSLWVAAQAWKFNKPQIKKLPKFPTKIPIHFYDIETHDGVVYLHGNIRLYGDDRQAVQYIARDASGEEQAWHDWLDFLAKDKKAHVYCWSEYERGFAESLWAKYGGNENGWKHLAGNLVDQCAFVRDHFALPTSGYSIKKVAPFFGFEWDAKDAGGLNSESWYGDWLESGDEAILKKILRYNLDDVTAMEVIHKKLVEFVKTL